MNIRLLFWLPAILVAVAPDALGCKYTVRDVGFVDLGSEPYRLFVSLPSQSVESAESATTQLRASLLDSNIRGIVLAANGGHPEDGTSGSAATLATVKQFLERQEFTRRPVGVLVSPDERMRLITPSAGGNTVADQSVTAAVRSIADVAATSPLRERIAGDLISAHSVVLLIEGNDAANNDAARDLANESIGHIAGSLKSLPKHIENPPKLVVVTTEQAASETVFLWSLGISTDEPDVTHLAALFGRLRKMGDVLTLPGATARDLSGFLYFVGQDCECELDRSVMQGTMAPHVWDGRLEADAAKELGFDPGHAVVRVEMSRILSRGYTSGRRDLGVGIGSSPFNQGALGYEEIEIEVLEDEEEAGDRDQVAWDRDQVPGDRGQETADRGPETGEQKTAAASQRLAGRSTGSSDPTTTKEPDAETGAAADFYAFSVSTNLGITASIIAAIVLVLCVVVIVRPKGGP